MALHVVTSGLTLRRHDILPYHDISNLVELLEDDFLSCRDMSSLVEPLIFACSTMSRHDSLVEDIAEHMFDHVATW